jgi:hypothetical protein
MTTDSQEITGLILFKEKNVYGQPLKYPMNDYAEFICSLAGTNTITDWMHDLCERVGLAVQSQEDNMRYRMALLERKISAQDNK